MAETSPGLAMPATNVRAALTIDGLAPLAVKEIAGTEALSVLYGFETARRRGGAGSQGRAEGRGRDRRRT
ncbi:hypothetical protein [Sorangium sp. So ce861]|uniref:hypothetical protein n=1 Tax=Sorangium sp. So ce861 TaxID=3133323 RepID=UPI003F605EAC